MNNLPLDIRCLLYKNLHHTDIFNLSKVNKAWRAAYRKAFPSKNDLLCYLYLKCIRDGDVVYYLNLELLLDTAIYIPSEVLPHLLCWSITEIKAVGSTLLRPLLKYCGENYSSHKIDHTLLCALAIEKQCAECVDAVLDENISTDVARKIMHMAVDYDSENYQIGGFSAIYCVLKRYVIRNCDVIGREYMSRLIGLAIKMEINTIFTILLLVEGQLTPSELMKYVDIDYLCECPVTSERRLIACILYEYNCSVVENPDPRAKLSHLFAN